ncbi:MAG TPA: YncE family protein [Pseudonocardia sp.]|uniref:YncE family protein n=1 Tax=Pseudonocardia sp. TaxID=60912 RepID=UPI002B77D65E|nr:YncE family protein [Pseudonocardia sp.]HTF53959.1 YncE family protein [Pseudonocardia sp.]
MSELRPHSDAGRPDASAATQAPRADEKNGTPDEPRHWLEPPAKPTTGRQGRRLIIVLACITAFAVLVAIGAVVSTFTTPTGGSAGSKGGPPVGSPVVIGGPVQQGPAPIGTSVPKPSVGQTIPVGPTPGYMEIAPNGEYAYIANRAAGVLTVFDTTRNAVTGTIPVPQGGPQFVAFSPDGTRAYVSIFNNNRTVNVVGVLDTASGQFLAMVPVGVRPFALGVTPDGKRVYVPNHDSGSITVIDTGTNTVAQTIQVAPNPHWLDISRDGTRVYAANHESNLVSVIDSASNTVLATIPVGISPHSIIAHPDKPLVLNVNYDSNTVSAIDPKTNAVIKTIPTGSHPQDITLSADGRHVYIATVDENAIQVLSVQSLEITATVPTGKSPTSVAVAPDGRQAYVTNLADGTVTVLNVAGTA